MGFPNLIPIPADGDWPAVRKAFQLLASLKLGPGSSPHFSGLDVDSLTITGLSGVMKAIGGVVSGSAVHADLGSIGANDHHNQIHALVGSDHTVSGLTPGHVLTALTASTFGFAAASGFANPMTTLGDIITGGVSGAAGRLGIGTEGHVLTVTSGVPAWAAATGSGGGNSLDTYGVFQTLLETYRIAGRGITKLSDGIVINGLSAGWSDSSLSSGFANDSTYGFQYPTGGNVLVLYQEWGDYQSTAVGDSAGTEFRQAQSFTLGATTIISGASLGIEALTGGITDALIIRIETDNAGSPSGTLANAALATTKVGVAGEWCNAAFPGSAALAAGTYWLVVYVPDQSNNKLYRWNLSRSNPYSGGARKQSSNGGTSWTQPSALDDFQFKLWVTAVVDTQQAVQDGSVSVGDVSNVEYRMAQSFQTSGAISCPQIAVYMGAKAGAPTGNFTMRIETDNAGFPSGTLVDANATASLASTTDSAWNVFVFPANIALSASTTYWLVTSVANQALNVRWTVRIQLTGAYANGLLVKSTDGGATWSTYDAGVYDLTFRVYSTQAVTANAVIISNAIPLSAVPTRCKFLILYSETDMSVTLNTDLKLFASRDDGATFTELTATLSTGDPRWKVAYGEVDVSGQPSGQIGRFKVTTANLKNVFIHGYAAQWS